MKKRRYLLYLIPLFLALSILAGCSDDDDDSLDHEPTPGFGSLVVQNRTNDDIEVFVDSRFVFVADEGESDVSDLTPGEHRLVLTDQDGDRSFADDIDILRGRLTVVEVFASFGDNYEVNVKIED